MLDTIDVFDVDWLAGMSVGLFTPDFVDAKTLAQDLRHIFGDQAKGPLAGLVKMEVIDRLNALLVISPRAEYVDKVASWIERLDRDSGTVGQRLFIYHVQNGKAAELADVLNQVFREEGAAQTLPAAEVAPGLEPAEIESESGPGSATGGAEQAQTAPGPSRAPPSEPRRRSTGAEEGLTISRESAVRIIADEVNNALLIMATAQQFRQIHAALKQLDIVPLQVLIEATIAEVTPDRSPLARARVVLQEPSAESEDGYRDPRSGRHRWPCRGSPGIFLRHHRLG